MRLDVYLFSSGLCRSRQRGRGLIEKGLVTVDGKVCTKASFDVEGKTVQITGNDIPYVSRGGLKLEGALSGFGVDVSGKKCCDIGSSTGGFTNCLLLNGAKQVFAVDSGSNQLHESLRNDPRVTVMENFNARYIKKENVDGHCDIVVMDVSFISQSLIYSGVSDILKAGGVYISLIKPQFEAGRDALNKKGIVSDRLRHLAVIKHLLEQGRLHGLVMDDLMVSPITGGDGNVEYLAKFIKTDQTFACDVLPLDEYKIKQVVYEK